MKTSNTIVGHRAVVLLTLKSKAATFQSGEIVTISSVQRGGKVGIVERELREGEESYHAAGLRWMSGVEFRALRLLENPKYNVEFTSVEQLDTFMFSVEMLNGEVIRQRDRYGDVMIAAKYGAAGARARAIASLLNAYGLRPGQEMILKIRAAG